MKKILTIIFAVFFAFSLSACGNKDYFDTVRTFDRAVLSLQDGTVISGAVESWTDYADGDQLQVKINGVVYLVHSSCVTLIND